MIRWLLVLVACCGLTQLSCKLNDYCLSCETGGDGGVHDILPIDSPPDGTDAGPCVATGDEVCDGIDNDCDGLVDEGTLPEVGDMCANQVGECAGGVKICAPTFHCSVTIAQACLDANDTTCPQSETCKADGKSTDHVACDKNPQPESCDGKDNNCNGTIDEGDPNGGGRCGNGTGTCVQGVLHCAGSCVNMPDTCAGTDSVSCVGGVGPATEVCDGLDNNCDGFIDNGVPTGGTCGTSNVGACKQGIIACIGGGTVCSGHCSATTSQPCGSGLPSCPGAETCVTPVNPTLETCNNADDDCDGQTDEDFKDAGGIFNQSTQNCGGCGMVCGAGLANGGNAIWSCSGAGTCVIAACKSGYHDNNMSAADGCEFGQCFSSGPEVCDGVDNDCDGMIDETGDIGTPPTICASQGECKGTTSSCPCHDTADSAGCTTGGTCTTTCATSGGWRCNYPATVSVDAFGNIVAETKCDNLDNDCDGIIDNSQTQMEHADCAGYVVGNASACPITPVACNDGKLGICRGSGQYQCDDGTFTGSTPGGNLNGPALCNISSPGSAPGTESCNNSDDDCDGVVDEGSSTGSLGGQTWVDIGGGHQMMEFEAERPDATSSNAGVLSTNVCSQETIAGASTTIAAASNGAVLPQGTINVASASAFSTTFTITVVTSAGNQVVTCTGKTATTFTGCTGGTGTMSTGGAVTMNTVSESGTTATYTTNVAHGLKVGSRVIVSGVGGSSYNGTLFVTGVPSTTTFTATLGSSGLAVSGGGLVSLHCPVTITATIEAGTTATYTTSAAHGLFAGDAVIISGVGVSGYNGTWVVLSTTSTTFTVQLTTSGLAASSGGTVSTNGIATCSKQTFEPWVNVTYPQALAACQAVGATLCTDQEWHRSCSGNNGNNNLPTVYPVSTSGGLLIEAEDYYSASYATDPAGVVHSFVEDYTSGFFGISDMLAQPNLNVDNITGGAGGNAPTNAPRLDYQVKFTATSANWHVCVHMYANSANDNELFVGVNASLPGTANGTAITTTCGGNYPCWAWVQSPAFNITTGTTDFVSIYMGRDGTKVDALYIANGNCPGTLTASSEAGTVNGSAFAWAMQPTPSYTSGNCNDSNYAGAGSGAPLATGALASCYADDSGLKASSTNQHVFDLSGNIKEWTFAHQPGQDPIRGGAYNSTKNGIDCALNFLLADDKFFFPDVGFRCCR